MSCNSGVGPSSFHIPLHLPPLPESMERKAPGERAAKCPSLAHALIHGDDRSCSHFAFTSPPGQAEASVLGTATWTTETVLLVLGEILMVCRGKGRRKGREGILCCLCRY